MSPQRLRLKALKDILQLSCDMANVKLQLLWSRSGKNAVHDDPNEATGNWSIDSFAPARTGTDAGEVCGKVGGDVSNRESLGESASPTFTTSDGKD